MIELCAMDPGLSSLSKVRQNYFFLSRRRERGYACAMLSSHFLERGVFDYMARSSTIQVSIVLSTAVVDYSTAMSADL